jgi:PadR family transcriptional regulator, regulatory protein PadR
MTAMRQTTYYALAVLLEGPRHGYAILDLVREMTGGRVSLTTGTLYATLDRLVDDDMIRRTGTEIVNGRARQYFEITDKGSGAVQAEATRLEEAAAAVRRALGAKNTERAGRPARGRSPVPRLPFGLSAWS